MPLGRLKTPLRGPPADSWRDRNCSAAAAVAKKHPGSVATRRGMQLSLFCFAQGSKGAAHLVCCGEVGDDHPRPQRVLAPHPGLGVLKSDRQVQVVKIAASSRILGSITAPGPWGQQHACWAAALGWCQHPPVARRGLELGQAVRAQDAVHDRASIHAAIAAVAGQQLGQHCHLAKAVQPQRSAS